MTTLVSLTNSTNPRILCVNSGPSTAITNTATETVLDQIFTYPSQQNRSPQAPQLIRMKAWGIISTGLVNLGLTINVRWGGLSGVLLASTGAIMVTGSLSQQAWNTSMDCVIISSGSSGAMEAQGFISFQAGLLSINSPSMANTAPITISTSSTSDLVFTAQWASAAAANSIQSRLIYVIVDGP